MPKLNLSYSEKLQLLLDLKKFYMEDFEYVCDDISPHLWYLKGTSIWLIIDCLNTFSNWVKEWWELSINEINFILSNVITEDYVKLITENMDEEESDFIKWWFWCSLWILWWDKKTINNARKTLQSVWWVEIKTSFI